MVHCPSRRVARGAAVGAAELLFSLRGDEDNRDILRICAGVDDHTQPCFCAVFGAITVNDFGQLCRRRQIG